MRRKKIIFISGSRSDFGLIQSVLKSFANSSGYYVVLIRVGHSIASEEDFNEKLEGIHIDKIITKKGINRVSKELDVPLAISQIISAAAKYFFKSTPDIIFVPGDRFENLACVIAAFYQRIPIAHIFGGDRTTGGHLDDNIRHAITKMAHLHFTICNDSFKRVIKLGEQKERVYNFGSPVVDNLKEISNQPIISEPYAIMTEHSITGMPDRSYKDTKNILKSLGEDGIRTFITAPNNEFGSESIMKGIREAVTIYPNLSYVDNLGWEKYLTYLKHACFSIGNSSSNMLEAPILGTPSIDVGDRQQGRYAPKSVIRVPNDLEAISRAIKKAKSIDKLTISHPYGTGNVGDRIYSTIDEWLGRKDLIYKKISY